MSQSLRCVRHLFHNVRLGVVFEDVVKLFLTFDLIGPQLAFQTLLLLDFFFSNAEIALQIDQKVRLLYELETALQLFMFLHQT